MTCRILSSTKALAVLWGLAAAAGVAGLCGCASAPATSFYTLNSSAVGRPAGDRGSLQTTAQTLQVTIGPVTVPDYVDRPQLVLRVGPNEQRVFEQQRWTQPLAREIDSTLAASLARQLDQAQVTTLGQSAAANAAYRVSLDVLRFDSERGREIQSEILWTMRDRQGRTVDSGLQRVQRPVDGPGFDAVVAAHSAALDQLAGTLAASLKRLPPPVAATVTLPAGAPASSNGIPAANVTSTPAGTATGASTAK